MVVDAWAAHNNVEHLQHQYKRLEEYILFKHYPAVELMVATSPFIVKASIQ